MREAFIVYRRTRNLSCCPGSTPLAVRDDTWDETRRLTPAYFFTETEYSKSLAFVKLCGQQCQFSEEGLDPFPLLNPQSRRLYICARCVVFHDVSDGVFTRYGVVFLASILHPTEVHTPVIIFGGT